MKRFTLFLLWITLSATLLSASNTLLKVEIKNKELQLTFLSWLNNKDIKQMVLSNPARQVIDIKNTRLGKGVRASSLSCNGVSSFRIAQRRNNVVRIVVETGSRYNCKGYQSMASRTVYKIPLPESAQERIASKQIASKKNQAKPIKQSKKAPAKRVKRVKKSPIITKKQSPKIEVAEEKTSIFASLFDSSSPEPKRSYTIVVDAGHGGHDSGAIGSRRYYEKTVVLQISKRVEKYLKKKGYKVKMTRSSDRFVKLKNRTHFANRYKADIFVSIHANAIANRKRFRKVHGIETYFLQITRSARSQRVAAIENSVVLDKNDYLSKNVILKSVLSGPKIALSHKLAIDVQSRMLSNVKKKYRWVKDNGVKPAPFWVLVGAQMPSILVEVGYITNPTERKRLFSADYQNRLAKGIAEGISNYLALREKEMY
ncbi:MAG: N-acetylmuramoyl-L-alanine amidase [Epsilonproteobacteria bacterium]|nr:MAG: N-acetylmuramoyl-L-alanine amidase [Campylobacterota bacterium]